MCVIACIVLIFACRRDGGIATVFISVAGGTLSKDEETRINDELRDYGCYVMVNGSHQSFFTSDTATYYYEMVLGPAFRAKRNLLGIGDDVQHGKGLCIPCTTMRCWDQRSLPFRQQWEKRHNVKVSAVGREQESQTQVYTYIRIYIYSHIHVYTRRTRRGTYVYTYDHTCTHLHTALKHIHTYVHMCACIYTFMFGL